MDRVIFSFAQIVEKLPPKRNKHYTRDFAFNLTTKKDILIVAHLIRCDIGSNVLVSNVNINYHTDCYVAISFSYAYPDSQLTTPWDVAQNGTIAFLLCAKLLGLHRDVSLIVAKNVYTNIVLKDLYSFTWNGGVELTWLTDHWSGRDFLEFGACLKCKYPRHTKFCAKCLK